MSQQRTVLLMYMYNIMKSVGIDKVGGGETGKQVSTLSQEVM